jgi:hypothetical protein
MDGTELVAMKLLAAEALPWLALAAMALLVFTLTRLR